MPHWECTSSSGMGMCLTGNAHPHQEWGCAALGMHILIGNAHSLYRVSMIKIIWFVLDLFNFEDS